MKKRNKFQILDCCKPYLDSIERIGKSGYVPTDADILNSRIKTSGIFEIDFMIETNKFILIDVGGQRSERKKWLNCFEGITAVLFCVALSEYDLSLYEDNSVNRMKESLKIFDEICNSIYFDNTSIILFLNKFDLFEEKIKKIPLTVCFDDFSGSSSVDEAAEFINNKFFQLNMNPKEKNIYSHLTQAIDTNNIKFVFESVQEIIIHNNIKKQDPL